MWQTAGLSNRGNLIRKTFDRMTSSPTPLHSNARAPRAPGLTIIFCFAFGAMMCSAFPPSAVAVESGPSEEVLRARLEALVLDPRIDEVPVGDAEFLLGFYARRSFAPLWSASARLEELIAALEQSARHGLNRGDYHYEALVLGHAESGQASTLARANLDILATDALARYAYHLRFGKINPEELEPSWNFTRTLAGTNPIDAIARLAEASDLGAALDADPR
jgi:L,D-transpeptidase YcbB